MFLFLKDVDLANFADDNTIYTANKSIEKLLEVLERESKSAIDWFKINDMIVNPDKFQAMILSSDKKDKKFQLNINDSTISSEDSVTLLGIEINNKLNFKNHVSTICKKANRQLNAIGRIQNYDCNWTRSQNYFVLKRTLNHLTKLLRARSSLSFRQL